MNTGADVVISLQNYIKYAMKSRVSILVLFAMVFITLETKL